MILADVLIEITRIIKFFYTKSTTKVPTMARALFFH